MTGHTARPESWDEITRWALTDEPPPAADALLELIGRCERLEQQLRQLKPANTAQLAAAIRTACASTRIHQPAVAVLMELANQAERQTITPADLRAIATELSRYQ